MEDLSLRTFEQVDFRENSLNQGQDMVNMIEVSWGFEVNRLRIDTKIELYLDIYDINCLHCVLGGGTREHITCLHG